MRLNKILHISVLAVLFVLASCSSSGDDSPTPPPPTGGGDDDPVVVTGPGAANLTFPENNSECTTGVVDPEDDTKSAVTFEWDAGQNADRYTITITNLNSGSSVFASPSTNEATVTIDRGTPYSWVVTSRANGTSETADSQTFRFYNEGPGVENYAPFPAEAVAPARGVNLPMDTTAVTLEWSGSDVDNDITGYEVFFGTDVNPTTSIGSGAETSLADVAVTSGTTYYWVVVTTDSAGNTSSSEVFSFKVG